MIAGRQNQKKIKKKEIEYLNLIDNTTINLENVNPIYVDNPEKNLLSDKVEEKHQKSVEEFLSIINKDMPNISLYNKFIFNFLKIEYFRIKNGFNVDQFSERDVLFINDIDNCISNPSNNNIEKIYHKYKIQIKLVFGDFESLDFFQKIKEGESKIKPLITNLKNEIKQNRYSFIKSVNFNKLENTFIFYYVLDNFRPIIQPILQKVIKEISYELEFLNPDSLNKLDLNKTDKYKKIFQEQKDLIIPKSVNENLGIEQDEVLKIQKKSLELFSLISFDFFFSNIIDVFTLNENNKIGLASILYNFFLVTHEKTHPVYEFYTEKEWWDEQDRKGNIPTNRKWKNHKLLRIKNIIPNF